mgnify:CR=1 FL=1
MTAGLLFWLAGSGLIGLSVYGLIVNPHPLCKLLALNLLGSGVFLLFGVIARRGAAAGLGNRLIDRPRSRHLTALGGPGALAVLNPVQIGVNPTERE